jgi:hypothetical protein
VLNVQFDSHNFSTGKFRRMTETAADLLASTPPAAVTLGRILFHPEAIMLGVTPAETLTVIVMFSAQALEVQGMGPAQRIRNRMVTPSGNSLRAQHFAR